MGWVSVASSVLAFLVYYNTLDAGFVYDDRRAILTNPDVLGQTSIKSLFQNDFWGTPLTDDGSHGSYRPLCVFTYRMNYALSGLRPWSYHFLNIIFHCMATVLVVAVAKRLLPQSCATVGTAVAGITFAVHPIHTEAVAGVVGRADLAACNLFLLSFLLYMEHVRLRDEPKKRYIQRCKQINTASYIRQQRSPVCSERSFRISCHGLFQQLDICVRRLLKAGKIAPWLLLSGNLPIVFKSKPDAIKMRRECECSVRDSGCESEVLQWMTLAGTLLLAVAATLCKEPAISVLPLCIIYDFLRSAGEENRISKKRWLSVYTLGVGGITLFYWRIRLAGSPPVFATADNPAAREASFITRTLTFAYLPIFNFFLLICPTQLSFDWSMDAIPRISSIFDIRNIFTIIFFTIVSRVTWKAVLHEFTKRQHVSYKESRYHKNRYGHSKRNQKRINYMYNNKIAHKHGIEGIEHYSQCREGGHTKKLCTGCKHSLTEDHTNACRAINNNNTMTQQSVCFCIVYNENKTKLFKPKERRSPQKSANVALLIFIGFMLLPFFPASNALFYVGFVVAERVLYMPSVGFCLLLGLGAGMLTRGWHTHERRSKAFSVIVLVVIMAMCGRTFYRNLDWRDEESLFRSALHINPPKAYGNLGSILSAQGRIAEAETAFQRALLHRPNMADVHYNLGILLQNQRRYEEAIKSLERAITFRPSMALAYVNLGASLIADGRTAEAASVLRAGAKVDGARVRNRREHDGARVSALIQLAALHVQRGHWHKALSAYREALDIIPEAGVPVVGWNRHTVLTMAGEIYVQLQQWQQAERNTLAALAAAPYDVPTQIAYAKLLARNSSRAVEAETWYKKALSLAPSDPLVRDQYGLFLRSQRRIPEAAEQFLAAARLAPNDGPRAAAAARALRDARRCRAAERWYARAVQLNPEVAENHSNLGAILHLNGKYAQALISYHKALQLQPGDDITITNLKRVKALMTNGHKK